MSNERQQQIKERAYALWEAEGHPADRADAHWQQAQAEVDAEVNEDKNVMVPPIGKVGADGAVEPAMLAAASPAATALPNGRRKKA